MQFVIQNLSEHKIRLSERRKGWNHDNNKNKKRRKEYTANSVKFVVSLIYWLSHSLFLANSFWPMALKYNYLPGETPNKHMYEAAIRWEWEQVENESEAHLGREREREYERGNTWVALNDLWPAAAVYPNPSLSPLLTLISHVFPILVSSEPSSSTTFPLRFPLPIEMFELSFRNGWKCVLLLFANVDVIEEILLVALSFAV